MCAVGGGHYWAMYLVLDTVVAARTGGEEQARRVEPRSDTMMNLPAPSRQKRSASYPG